MRRSTAKRDPGWYRWSRFAVVLAIAWSLGPDARAQPDLAEIERYVAEQLEADGVPGGVLVLVRGGEVMAVRAFGRDGRGRPVDGSTAFVLGSLSKSFTAIAILQLAAAGRLSIDDPVQQHLPEFAVADPEASQRITIAHLLHHTSGIPSSAPQARADDRSLAGHVRALRDVDLAHSPGTVHEYASPNYQVLGAIIEAVDGRDYARYVQEEIFGRLGTSCSYTDRAAAGDDFGFGHRYWFGLPFRSNLREEGDRLPTAALMSCGDDIAKYLVALLDAVRNPLLPPGWGDEPFAGGLEGARFRYAKGWRIGEIADGVTAAHHGGIVPDHRGKLVLFPESKPEDRWGVAVLTNVSSVLPIEPTSHRIADAVGAAVQGRPLPSISMRLRAVYLAIAVASLFVLVSGYRNWRGAGAWAEQRRRHRIGLAFSFAMPLLLMVVLPRAIGIPLVEVFRSAPDLALVLVVASAIELLVATRRTLALRRRGS